MWCGQMEEMAAKEEAYKAEVMREVERVRAEEERQKAELRAKVNELVQSESREKQQVRPTTRSRASDPMPVLTWRVVAAAEGALRPREG